MTGRGKTHRRDIRPSLKTLPFVCKNPRSLWATPDEADPSKAIELGYRWGDDFAQFLLQRPDRVGAGLLFAIARDMRFEPEHIASAYAIGFLSRIEQVLRIGAAALVGLPPAEFAHALPSLTLDELND